MYLEKANLPATRSGRRQDHTFEAVRFRLRQVERESQPHFGCHCSLLLVTNGDVEISINQKIIAVKTGEIVCYLAIYPHRIESASLDNRVVQIDIPHSTIFELSDAPDLQQFLHSGEPLKMRYENFLSETKLTRWSDEFGNRDPRVKSIVRDELFLALRRMLLSVSDLPQQFDSPVRRKVLLHVPGMIEFLSRNHERKLPIVDVTNAVGLEKCYGMKLFKQAMGISILEYLTQLRLNHACNLLQYSTVPIIQVAFDSGFSSLSRFYEVFSAQTNCSPLAFRRQCQSDKLH